jgi:hypothetical protein
MFNVVVRAPEALNIIRPASSEVKSEEDVIYSTGYTTSKQRKSTEQQDGTEGAENCGVFLATVGPR